MILLYRYLGSGCSLIELHYSYRIGHSTICQIVRKVCKVIWDVLKKECIPTFTEEKWLEIASRFEVQANFPNCIGAIDGKHIRIVKPEMSGSLYFNYKHFYSVVLLAVADSNYQFLYVDIGSYGKNSDSSIFQSSDFNRGLVNNTLNIPRGKQLPGTGGPSMPYVFVGDEAFGLSQNILRPYAGKFLSHKKRVFNYRLSRARRYVECTFGILSNKWRIFHKPINVKVEFAVAITKACCILHNYVRCRDGYKFEDTLTVEGFEDILANTSSIAQGGNAANQNRNRWADYFLSDIGRVPWQDNFV